MMAGRELHAWGPGPSPRPVVVAVDDDPAILRALGRSLRYEPYELMAWGTPERALAWMERGCAALVLSDERMPGMSGTDLLEAVSRRSPGTNLALMTAFPESGVVARETAFPIRRVIAKPWNDLDLKETIRILLRTRGHPGAPAPSPDELLRCRPGWKPLRPVLETRIDLKGQTTEGVLDQVLPLCLWSHASKERPVIVLENPSRFAGALPTLIRDLARVAERVDARLHLEDPSGYVTAILGPPGQDENGGHRGS